MGLDPNQMSDRARAMIAPEHRRELGISTREEVEEQNDILSERELQNQICDYLRTKDIVVSCQRMDRRSNVAIGMADMLLCYFSVPLAFECKVGRNEQTREQNEMELKMIRNGWRYYIIRNLSEVRAILTAIEVKHGL